MTLTPWMHENPFLSGTIVRADAMNLKLDGIAQAIQAICSQINQKIPNLPATFAGETQIPEKTLPNTLLLINSAGAMDLYPKAQFDTDVANAASAAAQAATSAANAQNSANQAQVHERNAEEHAEAAFNSATAAAAFADSAEQAKDDTMSALNTRLGTTGNLGTAAQRNVMTSLTDTTTPDALMPRGAFGYGGIVQSYSGNVDDFTIPNGLYLVGPSNVGSKPGAGFWTLEVIGLGDRARQIWRDTSETYTFERQYNQSIGVWRRFDRVFTALNAVGAVFNDAGGTPAGSVFEVSTGPIGTYLKLLEGTLICFFTSPLEVTTDGPLSGSLHPSGVLTFNFPSIFVGLPTVVPAPRTSNGPIFQNNFSITTSSFSAEFWGTNQTRKGFMGYMAIGRWK